MSMKKFIFISVASLKFPVLKNKLFQSYAVVQGFLKKVFKIPIFNPTSYHCYFLLKFGTFEPCNLINYTLI